MVYSSGPHQGNVVGATRSQLAGGSLSLWFKLDGTRRGTHTPHQHVSRTLGEGGRGEGRGGEGRGGEGRGGGYYTAHAKAHLKRSGMVQVSAP